jgi:hypothetical protein
MSAAEHQRPVQALGPDGPDPSFGEGVRSRRLDRRADDPMPSLANTASKLEAYFESRSLIRNRKLLPLVRSNDRFLACCVTQAAAGFLVAPARWTRLVRSSITKHTYRVLSQMDSTVKKSVARIPSARTVRNFRQVGPDRRGAGPSPL